MNYLELCKKVGKTAKTIQGISNITTLVGATGRIADVAAWVSDAWVDIQNERNDWMWMRRRFNGPLTIGLSAYAFGDMGIARFAQWLPDIPGWRNVSLYDPAIGQQDEGHIEQIGYERWADMYDTGTHDAQRPTSWAIAPDGKIVFGPKPDKAYQVRGWYRVGPQILTNDTDIPEMPIHHHQLIVIEAIRLNARGDEAVIGIQVANDQYARLRGPLVREQTPMVSMIGYPLA